MFAPAWRDRQVVQRGEAAWKGIYTVVSLIGFVLLAGHGVLRATAHTKFLNFASNLGGLCVFAAQGAPWWAMGLAMGAAQIAGARLGARLAMRIGAKVIKPLLVFSASALALRLVWQML